MGLQDGALLQEGRWEDLPAGGQLSSLGLDPSEGSLGGDRTAERDVLDPQLPTPWLQSPVPSMGAPVQTQVRLFGSSCYPDGTMGYHAGPRTTLLRLPWPWHSSDSSRSVTGSGGPSTLAE